VRNATGDDYQMLVSVHASIMRTSWFGQSNACVRKLSEWSTAVRYGRQYGLHDTATLWGEVGLLNLTLWGLKSLD